MPAENFNKTFASCHKKGKKPVIGVSHLEFFGNPQMEPSGAQRILTKGVKSDVENLIAAPVDGVLFENWGKYTGDMMTQEVRNMMTAAILEVARDIKVPFGVHAIASDYKATFDIARDTRSNFVLINAFVDKPEVKPADIIAYMETLKLEKKVLLMTNVQSPRYLTVPAGKPIEVSVEQAIENGSGAIVVTSRVGEKPSLDNLLRAKKVAGDTPVLIGSGLNVDNAAQLFPYSDGAIVGTSLKYYNTTRSYVSRDKSEKFMRVIDSLRR